MSLRSLMPLLYLASPALPTGAFSWSQGLAPACESSLVTDASSLREWWLVTLRFSLERFDIPLLLRCRAAAEARDSSALFAWDALVFAGRESAESWLEEEQTGKALCRLLRMQGLWPDWAGARDCGQIAAFALAAACLDEDSEGDGRETACAWLWSRFENQAAAACKCLPLGQSAVQKILLEFLPLIPESVERASRIPDEEVGACLPGATLAAFGHERQYSRLFRG